MFKLPVCPYCHAVNSYNDVRKSTKLKVKRCHHCNAMYRISYLAGRIILLSVVGTLLIAFNLLILYTSKVLDLRLMTIVTFLGVDLAVVLFPFTVRYKTMSRQEIKEYTKQQKKNKPE
ncbi:MAG: hypothetical protein ACI4M3_06475 [Acutalibacteraceae bacterium]